MKLLITGGSGTIGQEITKLALAKKYEVNILTRNKKLRSKNIYLKYYYWNPKNEEIDKECFKDVNSVINLAGFSVFNLWTKKNKLKILNSRINSTSFILKYIRENKINIKSFVSASGIAAYPNSIEKKSSEFDSVNLKDSFINQVVLKWEEKVFEYDKILPNISFSVLRVGLVLSKFDGLFQVSKKLAKYYLLSPLGAGNQWQSWVHVEDASNIFLNSAKNNIRGICNVVSPNPISQNELIKKIAIYNRSKILFPNIPKVLVKIFFGEMSELVLSSQKVISNNLINYDFIFPDIDAALKDLSEQV